MSNCCCGNIECSTYGCIKYRAKWGMSFPSSTITEIPKNERKIVDYITVNEHVDGIDDAVLCYIKAGWEIYGYLSLFKSEDNENYAIQVMVKYEDK